jgi:hypothetical protein
VKASLNSGRLQLLVTPENLRSGLGVAAPPYGSIAANHRDGAAAGVSLGLMIG